MYIYLAQGLSNHFQLSGAVENIGVLITATDDNYLHSGSAKTHLWAHHGMLTDCPRHGSLMGLDLLYEFKYGHLVN